MAHFGITTQQGSPPIQRGGWLDALRFIVACLIILHHFQGAAPVPLMDYHPVFERAGYLLTNFFIIDSGYVLARVYADRVAGGGMSHGAFVRKRFARVVPAHLVMVTGLALMVLAAGALGIPPSNPEWFDWSQYPAQFFLVQSYGVPGGLGWNAPVWSISALLGCYVFFPVVARRMGPLSPWMVLGLAIVGYALANLFTWAVLGLPVYQMPMKYGFLRVFPLFLLGMALAHVAAKVYVPARLGAWVFGLASVAFIGLQFVGNYGLVSVTLISLIILGAGAIPVVKKSVLVEKLALVSFSMFISNEVVRIAWFGVAEVASDRFGWTEPTQWTVWALGMAAAVVFAIAYHFWFDMPLQRVIQPWAKTVGQRRARLQPSEAV